MKTVKVKAKKAKPLSARERALIEAIRRAPARDLQRLAQEARGAHRGA
jgi:hypothetical protein